MAGFNLERVLGDAAHLLGEAIKVRPRPAVKKPSEVVADALKGGKPARSIEVSRLSEGERRGPDAAPLPRSAAGSRSMTWPVASLGHAIDGARHRLFGSANAAVTPEIEAWVMHAEHPGAQPHPAKDRDACGLCIAYARRGQQPIAPQMVPVCPGCGEGGRHERDCPLVLAEHEIGEEDWEDLPGQLRFDTWAEENRRRGYLP